MRTSHIIMYGLLLYASIFLISSCGDTGNTSVVENPEALQEEMRSRELRRLTQAQITTAAYKIGRSLTDTLQQTLADQMKAAIAQEGIIEAAKYCDFQKLPVTPALQERYNTTIRRVRLSGKADESGLTDLERQVIDAYRYNVENKISLDDNIQRSGNEYMLYTAPLTLNAEVCLQCHGTSEYVSPETLQQLQSTYRMDGLINYSLNQPMGVLSTMLPKKAIVLSIDPN